SVKQRAFILVTDVAEGNVSAIGRWTSQICLSKRCTLGHRHLDSLLVLPSRRFLLPASLSLPFRYSGSRHPPVSHLQYSLACLPSNGMSSPAKEILHAISIEFLSDSGPHFVFQVWKTFCSSHGAKPQLLTHNPNVSVSTFPDSTIPSIRTHLRNCRIIGTRPYFSLKHRCIPASTFQPGQKVGLSSKDFPLKAYPKKLSPKYLGPFPIQSAISPSAVPHQLPPHLQVHPVFHISQIKLVNSNSSLRGASWMLSIQPPHWSFHLWNPSPGISFSSPSLLQLQPRMEESRRQQHHWFKVHVMLQLNVSKERPCHFCSYGPDALPHLPGISRVCKSGFDAPPVMLFGRLDAPPQRSPGPAVCLMVTRPKSTIPSSEELLY
ncbi:unnamed protein product, partial [Menidia menidia]